MPPPDVRLYPSTPANTLWPYRHRADGRGRAAAWAATDRTRHRLDPRPVCPTSSVQQGRVRAPLAAGAQATDLLLAGAALSSGVDTASSSAGRSETTAGNPRRPRPRGWQGR